jgi:hypothetical protein
VLEKIEGGVKGGTQNNLQILRAKIDLQPAATQAKV